MFFKSYTRSCKYPTRFNFYIFHRKLSRFNLLTPFI
nr:MAG TPA: hypothetical protein [Caudoviricetes sp.]DAX00452.1 MAG TPA: hypothetical protein [Bacteriophage sp.]